MKANKKQMNLSIWKIFCEILSVLLLFTVAGIAADESPTTDGVGTISASADGYAVGDSTSVTTEAVASDQGAYASAFAEASASDGRTAIAETTSQANYLDIASAYAHAVATAISSVGETTWAQAFTEAIASPDGSTSSKSTSMVWSAGYNNGGNGGNNGDNNNGGGNGNNNGGNGNGNNNGGNGNGNNNGGNGIDPNNGGGKNSFPIIQPIIVPPPDKGMFGFSFGKSDPGRYYYFKRVANYNETNGTTLRLADKINITSYSRARARDFMWQIAWDRGMNQTQFENKFKEENYTKEVEDIILKEEIGTTID